jgi:hypothetical protein
MYYVPLPIFATVIKHMWIVEYTYPMAKIGLLALGILLTQAV